MVDVCRSGGLGLVLIAVLASSWGAELQPHHGKRVWFELDACVRAIAAQPSPSPVKGVLFSTDSTPFLAPG